MVQAALTRFHIDNVNICEARLRSYGSFEWYAPPRQQLPTDFALVVCDGPQGTTLGDDMALCQFLAATFERVA